MSRYIYQLIVAYELTNLDDSSYLDYETEEYWFKYEHEAERAAKKFPLKKRILFQRISAHDNWCGN